MSVSSTHPEYNEYAPEWKKANDAFTGQRAIHNAKEDYLPKLSGQTMKEYDAYLKRATFYEATSRTVQGLSGMIFRKPPTIETGAMDGFLQDVDLQNDDIQAFAKGIVEDVLVKGRVGVLVDFPRLEIGEMTVSQAQQLNARPYFKKYDAESILNWKTGRIENKTVLTQLRLREIVDVEENEFKTKEIEQIRVLDINEGRYRQRVYRKNEKHEWIQIDEIVPLMNGAPLSYIPFCFFSPNTLSASVEAPPLIGLVNVNLSHYTTTADLEHGAHFTGLPTAVISGISESDTEQEFKIGSTTAWAFSNPDTKAKYLEFTGQGLEALEKRLQSKEEYMASLGAQMLTPSKRRNESTDTAVIRHMGENSILASISMAVSSGLNKILEIAGEWMNVEPATIDLNKDFLPQPMTPQMLKEIVGAWQSGAISYATLFDNLKEGEVIAYDKEQEEEASELQTEPIRL